MIHPHLKKLFSLFSLLLVLTLIGCSEKKEKQPNIVIIYADDMGYGDLNCQNPDSKIPTPHLDQLASEGMRFTDAHSSSGICSPSRFALLTGTYHWRRQHNIVDVFGEPFFKDSDVTLPQVLKTKGYTTACIGKWHLGWDWEFKNPPSGERNFYGANQKVYLTDDIDWEAPVKGGPLDRGFDYYFGDGTINFPPYAWIENDRFVEVPNDFYEMNQFDREAKEGGWDSRPGPKVEGWDPYQVLPTLTQKTMEWIDRQDAEEPFFLYLALPSPHSPIIPADEFDGSSEAGPYGDYVYQTDQIIGKVLASLKEKGFEENTIIIFSADNGPETFAWARGLKYGHFSSGQFRGLKRDVWEGGHHVPFIVKWPEHIKAGQVSDEVICQTDIMATLSEIVNIELPGQAAPDSYNILPVLTGQPYESPLREATVHNTYEDVWGIRKGDWLFIDHHTGSSKREAPQAYKELRKYEDFNTPGLLFNMREDEEQRNNLYEKHPEKVQELDKLLKSYRGK